MGAIGNCIRKRASQPVYFAIGPLISGGTVSSRGLLVWAEVNSLGKGNLPQDQGDPGCWFDLGTFEDANQVLLTVFANPGTIKLVRLVLL